MFADALTLRSGDRERLEAVVCAPTASPEAVQRARIVLLAADGVPNMRIAAQTGTTTPTVLRWRRRYVEFGPAGLTDRPRPGRKPLVDEVAVVAATLADGGRPPAEVGAGSWTSRLLAPRTGISYATVVRVWRHWGIDPRRVGSFTFATDPPLTPGSREVVGLYLGLGLSVAVLAADESTQSGHSHGSTLSISGGQAGRSPSASAERKPHCDSFAQFLSKVAAARPDEVLHVVASQKLDAMSDEVVAGARLRVYVAMPGNQPWSQVVAVCCRMADRQSARGGVLTSRHLEAAMAQAQAGRAEPVVWLASPRG